VGYLALFVALSSGVLEGVEGVGAVSKQADRGRLEREAAALQQRRQRLCVTSAGEGSQLRLGRRLGSHEERMHQRS
jgi:hypothetical protein